MDVAVVCVCVGVCECRQPLTQPTVSLSLVKEVVVRVWAGSTFAFEGRSARSGKSGGVGSCVQARARACWVRFPLFTRFRLLFWFRLFFWFRLLCFFFFFFPRLFLFVCTCACDLSQGAASRASRAFSALWKGPRVSLCERCGLVVETMPMWEAGQCLDLIFFPVVFFAI